MGCERSARPACLWLLIGPFPPLNASQRAGATTHARGGRQGRQAARMCVRWEEGALEGARSDRGIMQGSSGGTRGLCGKHQTRRRHAAQDERLKWGDLPVFFLPLWLRCGAVVGGACASTIASPSAACPVHVTTTSAAGRQLRTGRALVPPPPPSWTRPSIAAAARSHSTLPGATQAQLQLAPFPGRCCFLPPRILTR